VFISADTRNVSMQNDPYLTLILPAYNESRRIPITLEKTLSYLADKAYSWELIVVDDGSTDGTADVVEQTVVSENRVLILRESENRGKGYSLKVGVQKAAGKYIGFMDADYKTDVSCTGEALQYLEAGKDVVVGSRRLKGSRIELQPKFYRRAGSILFKRCMHLMFPELSSFQDTQCGFKFFQADVAKDIFSRLIVDRFMFDVEIFYLSHRLGYQIAEIPVLWNSDHDTRTTIVSAVVRNLIDLLRIRCKARD
jgi:dolichyl-phosphate beta-glucosyltransferase